ncbi:1357_t:CDS:2 [Paraglomus brasilianum]|uniref:1357_t:CDS:1 n=1 Tax=Paraglomus brasilianum TaxID=144538 RepID=A0A9N9F6T1_9GLOM|nr:1357_t:CDS:2 [Paraglomus brasilianum]
MAAVHKPFVFPVTGNTLIRMCQDAYEEGHKSLTVVLRPRITIVVGDVDTTCKKPRAAVEENVTYDRSVRHTNPDKAVSRRAGSHRMYEDRRIGSDDEIGWGNVFNIRNINDKLNEVTEVTNDKEKIQAPLAALSERSSDTSEVDSDDDSGFVYKPSDERIRAYASSSKQAASFESAGSVTTGETTRKPSSVSPSRSSSFSQPQSQQSAFQSWQSFQSSTSSIYDDPDDVPVQQVSDLSISSFIKPREKEELEQLALFSVRNPSKEHRYRFRTTPTFSQMKVTLVLDYKRLEELKLGGGNRWYFGNMPTVSQKQQMSQNLKCAYRFANGYQYFIDNRLLNENEIITLVQANQRRFMPKIQLAIQVYDLFTELGDKAFDRASSMDLTFLGRYSLNQHRMILDYVKQYKVEERYKVDETDGIWVSESDSSGLW